MNTSVELKHMDEHDFKGFESKWNSQGFLMCEHTRVCGCVVCGCVGVGVGGGCVCVCVCVCVGGGGGGGGGRCLKGGGGLLIVLNELGLGNG